MFRKLKTIWKLLWQADGFLKDYRDIIQIIDCYVADNPDDKYSKMWKEILEE